MRHGASRSTELEIVGGHLGCRGLSADGVLQCERLSSRWLQAPPFDDEFPYGAAYSSKMRRSLETAMLVMSPLGLALDGVYCELCEIHPGVTDGMPWSEVAEKFGDVATLHDPSEPIAPGGESWNQMTARACGLLRLLSERHRGETVLVFTHRGVVEATREGWLGSKTQTLGQGVDNTGLTTWIVETDDNGLFKATLASYNDFSHLDLS